MSNSIFIKDRLNWIDWAKVIAISFVVFGHIPQERGGFPVNYIIQFHMPLFFFVSGFLTKKEFPNKQTLKKYLHTLIIPYFIYNILFYPYWVVRHIIGCPNPEVYDFIKPLIGTFFLQLQTAYFESLNGVTWFIAALFLMKIILAICNRHKYAEAIIIFIGIADAIIYLLNDYYMIFTDLPLVGFAKCLPFFFIGHLCKQKKITQEKVQTKDRYIFLIGIAISLLTYYIAQNNKCMYMFGVYFWIINITAIGGLMSMCKLLDQVHSKIIDNISIGTIVIMGLHWMLIGITNYSLSKIFHLSEAITYPWYIATLLTILYIAVLYPVILLFRSKYPFMLGKRTTNPII